MGTFDRGSLAESRDLYINVLLNKWHNTFYDALQDKDWVVLLH